jgi:hypothetical protein
MSMLPCQVYVYALSLLLRILREGSIPTCMSQEKVSPTCPNQLELFWIKHLQVHIYMHFMHFIYTMDAFGLTILILMSLPCVNMLSGSLMLSICTFVLFDVSRRMARFSSRSNFFFHLHKSELKETDFSVLLWSRAAIARM